MADILTPELIARAEQAGIKLEVVNGLPMWEAFPAVRHQKAIYQIQRTITRIQKSIQPNADDTACGCYHYADIYVKFPDGSFKRPDIAIFCTDQVEQDEAVTKVPEAVIEIVSVGYEAKDLELGPLFYLAQGVKDVVVLEPFSGTVIHSRRNGVVRHVSPARIVLECDCEATV